MKDLFPSYYNTEEADFESLWNDSLFIFDTNVLLDIYRYQDETRKRLFKLLKENSNRIWIPHHVGLEFQRNRLDVISEQVSIYNDVKKMIEESISNLTNKIDSKNLRKRHNEINPDTFIENLNEISNKFITELNENQKKCLNVNDKDIIREEIDKLFNKRIGEPFNNQEEIDNLFKEGQDRYDLEIPPGFKDTNKRNKSDEIFTFGGINYKKSYGDLIIWKQIIKHAKDNHNNDIIFVTGDKKSDWWQIVNSNGNKTIGMRPELKDEIIRESKIKRIHFYTTEGFIENANNYLNANFDPKDIEDVKDVSNQASIGKLLMSTNNINYFNVEKTVSNWIFRKFSFLQVNLSAADDGFIDLNGYYNDDKYGFIIKSYNNVLSSRPLLQVVIDNAFHLINHGKYNELTIILVISVIHHEDILDILQSLKHPNMSSEGKIKVIVGTMGDNFDSSEFLVLDELTVKN